MGKSEDEDRIAAAVGKAVVKAAIDEAGARIGRAADGLLGSAEARLAEEEAEQARWRENLGYGLPGAPADPALPVPDASVVAAAAAIDAPKPKPKPGADALAELARLKAGGRSDIDAVLARAAAAKGPLSSAEVGEPEDDEPIEAAAPIAVPAEAAVEIDPVEAALARSRAARGLPEPTPEVHVDPVEAALARSRAARGLPEPTPEVHLDPAEAALARSRAVRGLPEAPPRPVDAAEAALARAREVLGGEAKATVMPLRATPADPFSAAEAALARSRALRGAPEPAPRAKPAPTAPREVPEGEAPPLSAPRAPKDPFAAAQAALERAKAVRGSAAVGSETAAREALARVELAALKRGAGGGRGGDEGGPNAPSDKPKGRKL